MHTVRRLSAWLHTLLVNDDNGDYGPLTNYSSQFPNLVIIARWECVRYRPTKCTWYHTYTIPHHTFQSLIEMCFSRWTDRRIAGHWIPRGKNIRLSTSQLAHCPYYTAAVSSERNHSVVRRLCSADRLRMPLIASLDRLQEAKASYRRGTARRSESVEMLSTVARYFKRNSSLHKMLRNIDASPIIGVSSV